jgi:hypothetical protein
MKKRGNYREDGSEEKGGNRNIKSRINPNRKRASIFEKGEK